jgi:hypothetical protein
VNGRTVAIDPLTGATTYSSLQNTLVPGSGNPVDGMHLSGLTGKGDLYSFPFLVFTPRLGFAWDVLGNNKMAIRGSFGTFYNRPNANFNPGWGSPTAIYTPVAYYSTLSQMAGATASTLASAVFAPTVATAIYGAQRIERTHEVNLTIQRDIGFGTVVDAGYVGNFDRHAQTTTQLNPIPEFAYSKPANLFNNTELNANLLRTAYPGMGAITYYSDSLSSVNYNALQVQVQHRWSHGLQFGLSYVFSRAMGTCGSYGVNGAGCPIADAYHSARNWYYQPLPWDITHNLNVNYSYQFPAAFSKGLAKHIFNDWTLSGMAAFSTGLPATPDCSSVNSGPTNSDPSLSGVGVWTASNQLQHFGVHAGGSRHLREYRAGHSASA